MVCKAIYESGALHYPRPSGWGPHADVERLKYEQQMDDVQKDEG
jgi:hypothetical protein